MLAQGVQAPKYGLSWLVRNSRRGFEAQGHECTKTLEKNSFTVQSTIMKTYFDSGSPWLLSVPADCVYLLVASGSPGVSGVFAALLRPTAALAHS